MRSTLCAVVLLLRTTRIYGSWIYAVSSPCCLQTIRIDDELGPEEVYKQTWACTYATIDTCCCLRRFNLFLNPRVVVNSGAARLPPPTLSSVPLQTLALQLSLLANLPLKWLLPDLEQFAFFSLPPIAVTRHYYAYYGSGDVHVSTRPSNACSSGLVGIPFNEELLFVSLMVLVSREGHRLSNHRNDFLGYECLTAFGS